MTNSTEFEASYDLALEIAYARKPYDEVTLTARRVGLLGVAAEIELKADAAEKSIEEITRAEERQKKKLEERQAFTRLCDETDEDILTKNDFKITHPQCGVDAWEQLRVQLEENPSPFMRFVEYYPDTVALIGDISSAAVETLDPHISPILNELVVVLDAQKPPAC